MFNGNKAVELNSRNEKLSLIPLERKDDKDAAFQPPKPLSTTHRARTLSN